MRAYHRPGTVEDALELLQRPGAVPLAGGTVLNGLPDEVPAEVVDLQALGLEAISRDGGTTSIGAMATLQSIADSEDVPPLLRDLARREAPSTIRNAATVGGTVAAADPESELLAGLLAHHTTVGIAGPHGATEVALADLLSDRSQLGGSVIISVLVSIGATGRAERAGRTPADTPIVMVAGVRDADGIRLAATGVAPTPVVIDLATLDALEPPPDFRGSAEYRRHLAGVLGARVLAGLDEEAPA